MTTEGDRKNDFRRAEKMIDVTVGESVRIIRELQEFSQNKLAELTGIPQSTISAIENDRAKLGVERAKALPGHLGAIRPFSYFPGWNTTQQSFFCGPR